EGLQQIVAVAWTIERAPAGDVAAAQRAPVGLHVGAVNALRLNAFAIDADAEIAGEQPSMHVHALGARAVLADDEGIAEQAWPADIDGLAAIQFARPCGEVEA